MQQSVATPIEKAPEADTPYNRVMKTWARWMTLADRQQAGAGNAHPQDVKEFMECGEAVEAMVNDLPRIQWWAIRKAHGITTAWRFPDHSFEEALVAAEAFLSLKMLRNIATRRYFN